MLWHAGQVYNPSTKQYHKAPPYIEQTRNAGNYYNGPTLRGWIIKYNMNSQSEMNGILSIMNDFVSWHVKTYGVGLEVYSGENEQIVTVPSLGENAVSLAEEVVGVPYLGDGQTWSGKGFDYKKRNSPNLAKLRTATGTGIINGQKQKVLTQYPRSVI